MIRDPSKDNIAKAKVDVPPLTQEKMAEALGMDSKEFRNQVKAATVDQLFSLANKILEKRPEWKPLYSLENVKTHLETIKAKKTFFESAKDKLKSVGSWIWKQKYKIALVAVIAGLAYLGFMYVNWNDFMSKAHEVAGTAYGDVKRIATGAPSITAGPISEGLKNVDSSGGAAPVIDAAKKAADFYD